MPVLPFALMKLKESLEEINLKLQAQVAGPGCEEPLPPELISIDALKSDFASQPQPTYLCTE